ncbi:MAG: O-antigen ligase family protein [Verrucomicrobia bacterium]|nr:O-antigen ligase family protein [Verrucomicrobiota bacterium]
MPPLSDGRPPILDAGLLSGLVFCSLVTAFLLGGTVFWTAAPVLVPALVLVLLSQGLAMFSGTPLKMVLPPGGAVWLVFWSYVLFRAIWIPRIPYQAWSVFLYVGAVFFLYVTLTDLCNRRHAARWVMGMFFIAVILQSMYALSLHYHGLRNVLWLQRPESYGMRASGTFICPNHFAQLLQMGLVLAAACLIWPGLGIPLKLVAGYSILVALPSIILSGSRAGWLGMVVGVGIVLLGGALRKGFKVTLLAIAALIPVSLGAFWSLYRYVPMVRDRVELSRRADVRFTALWPDTWRLIEGEGFWGAGPGMFRHLFEQYRHHFNVPRLYLRHAHNEFLHLIADYGWVIFFVVVFGLLVIVWTFVSTCWRERNSARMMIPLTLLALLFAKATHSAFDFNVHVLGNIVPFVLLVGGLYGYGLYEGIWKVRPLPTGLARPVLGISMLLTLGVLLGVSAFGWSNWAEYRMDQARRRQDMDAEKRYAAMIRTWTPFHWRGWTEYGFQLRSEAFLIRDPALRAEISEQARTAYETALRWNPYDRIAMLGLAQLDIREGNHEEALVILETLIVLDPLDEHVRTQYALTLRRLGRYPEALEAFREARRLEPGNRQALANIRWLEQQISGN